MGVSFFNLNSLRSRLLLLVALAIAPTAVMTVHNGWQERKHAIQVAQENLQRLTSLAAVNEAQSLESARQILRDLSSIPDLLMDEKKCEALLTDILRKNADYVNFGLIQLNGDVTCSAVPSTRRVNLGDRAHFKRAVSERRFIAGNYVFGRVIQKHTINLTYPVIDENNDVVAVVFAAMDLSQLDRFVSGVDLPQGSVLITADAEGTIISRRPNPEQWFGKKVSAEMLGVMSQDRPPPTLLFGPDKVERLHSFARVGSPDTSEYVVTIGIPRQIIVASAQRDQVMSLIGLAATIVLALVATWFVGEVLIVRRVHKLVETADKIASGSLDARTGIPYGAEEIGHLAHALDEMAAALQKKEADHTQAEQELRAADKRKDEFLAMLAHELRNPLAPISAGAQLLKLGYADREHVAQTSDIIARQVEHMTSLINDLLDVSRVTRGLVKLGKEPLDLKGIVADAVEQVNPLLIAREHQLDLHLQSDPAWVEGDHKRLVQVVANLLNNAAKYTPEGGHIRLDLVTVGQDLSLTITDDGIGMEPDLVVRVFELFAQAERTSDRSQGGLGLGLALVRSLVELHNGSVHAESDGLGHGSRFTVRLPRLLTPPQEIETKKRAPERSIKSRRMRFLVVDDNQDAVRTLQLFLTAAEHDVVGAHLAADALRLARETRPEVCLLDIGLPDFDGNELARRLRAMPETADAVLIALTGYGQEQDKERSIEAGFDYYFVKPLDTLKLAGLIADMADTPATNRRHSAVLMAHVRKEG